MGEREDYTDNDDATLAGYPWLALVGLTLPYSAVAFGWWVADLAAVGGRNDAWWDTAGNWVYSGVALAVLVAARCCLPVFRRVRHAGHLLLAGVLLAAYFALLVGFNLWVYVQTSGPFP
jgi:hypothetical protein